MSALRFPTIGLLGVLLSCDAFAQPAAPGCSVPPSLRAEMLGKTVTPELADAIAHASNASMYRIRKVGEYSTPDIRTSRVNIVVGADDKILSVHCF